MLALKINDVKSFMNQLLIGDTFDSFSLVEASITTFSNFTIDGKIHKDFFDTDTVQNMNFNDSDYCPWKELKSYCFQSYAANYCQYSFESFFSCLRLSIHYYLQILLSRFLLIRFAD